ncbi:MAG: hypothetical protein ACOYN5_10490 [Bacteroidales bacterium]
MKFKINILDAIFSIMALVSFFILPSIGNRFDQEWSLFKEFSKNISEIFGPYSHYITDINTRYFGILLVIPVTMSGLIILNMIFNHHVRIIRVLKIIGLIGFALSFVYLGTKISAGFQIKVGLWIFSVSMVYYLVSLLVHERK